MTVGTLRALWTHLASGARLSTRAAVPMAGFCALLVGFSPSPTASLLDCALEVATDSGSSSALLVLSVVSFSLSDWALPRLSRLATEWSDQARLGCTVRRRSMIVALAGAQAPALIAWTVLWTAAWVSGVSVSPVRLAALPVVSLGAVLVVLPSRRRWLSAPAGGVAILSTLAASWPALAAGTAVLALGEAAAGPLDNGWGSRVRRGLRRRTSGGAVAISLRELAPRLVATGSLALVPFGALACFLANNRLGPAGLSTAVRFATGLAVALVISNLPGVFAFRRRRGWGAQSVRRSSQGRLAEDALALGACAFPVTLLAAAFDLATGAVVASCVPYLAVRASGTVRSRRGSRAGLQGLTLLEGFLLAAWLGVTGWTAVVCVALLPLAWLTAVRQERRREVARWSPGPHRKTGHSLAAGGR